MVSFCNSGDTFCDSGFSLATHLGYVQSDGDRAVEFAVQMAQAAVAKRSLY